MISGYNTTTSTLPNSSTQVSLNTSETYYETGNSGKKLNFLAIPQHRDALQNDPRHFGYRIYIIDANQVPDTASLRKIDTIYRCIAGQKWPYQYFCAAPVPFDTYKFRLSKTHLGYVYSLLNKYPFLSMAPFSKWEETQPKSTPKLLRELEKGEHIAFQSPRPGSTQLQWYIVSYALEKYTKKQVYNILKDCNLGNNSRCKATNEVAAQPPKRKSKLPASTSTKSKTTYKEQGAISHLQRGAVGFASKVAARPTKRKLMTAFPNTLASTSTRSKTIAGQGAFIARLQSTVQQLTKEKSRLEKLAQMCGFYPHSGTSPYFGPINEGCANKK